MGSDDEDDEEQAYNEMRRAEELLLKKQQERLEKEKAAMLERERERQLKKLAETKQMAQDVSATMMAMPIEGNLVVSIVKNNNNVESLALYDKNHGDVRAILRQFAKDKNRSIEDINDFVRKNMGSNGLAFTKFPKANTRKNKPFYLNRDDCFPYLPKNLWRRIKKMAIRFIT